MLAVHPEFRRHGVGATPLAHADALGKDVGARCMAIIVASENDRAVDLYEKVACRETARRLLRPFPGYKRGGDWVRLTKPHSGVAPVD